MADETVTSPPGSWPDGSDMNDESSDERRHSTPEIVENVDTGMPKGKAKDPKDIPKRKAMLPPEILEQYA